MLREVGERAFADCTSLMNVTIPDSMHTISENAFRQCISLKVIKLSAGIKQIDHAAFFGCSNLRAVLIPSIARLEEIASLAFLCCSRLTVLELPTKTKVSPIAFYEANVLKEAAAGNDVNVCTFLQHRFDHLPLHKLLYHRHKDSNVAVVAKPGKARRLSFEATIFCEERPIISTLLLIVLPIDLQILASLEGADCEYYRTQVATIRECFVVVVRRWQSVQIHER